MSTAREKTTLPDLGKVLCIALTTFRKNGQAVTTPVMFAEAPGTIYVGTRGDAGKLKRLRRSGRVTFAPCTYSGKVTGEMIAGTARILKEPLECRTAEMLLSRKYGVMLPLTRNAWRLLHRKPKAEEVYLVIEPVAG